MADTVAAVVVTYNRKDLLIVCLEALRNQTKKPDAIYIVDNKSNDGTQELLYEKKYISKIPINGTNENQLIKHQVSSLKKTNENIKINYIRKCENDGGSGGFHEGMKQAYKDGYEWIWLMDDDVMPHIECLKNLFINKDSSNVLVPLRLDINGNVADSSTITFSKRNFLYKTWSFSFGTFKSGIKVEDVISKSGHILLENFAFEGPFINRSVIDKIGLCAKNLFILYDDTEYALRILKTHTSQIILIQNAKLIRLLANQKKITSSNWKLFYEVRNSLVLTKKYFPQKFMLVFLKQLRNSISSPYKLKLFIKGVFKSLSFKIEY